MRAHLVLAVVGLCSCAEPSGSLPTLGPDWTDGCATGSDCTIVESNCFVCSCGGHPVAVLKAKADAWLARVNDACRGQSSSPCNTSYACVKDPPVCSAGRCALPPSP